MFLLTPISPLTSIQGPDTGGPKDIGEFQREGGDSPVRILVVDDEQAITRMFQIVLERHGGYEVDTACDGIEAMEKMGETRFDLVLTDRDMPRMNGDGLIKQIHENHPETKTIMISGNAITEQEKQDIRADQYLQKPISPIELLREVNEILPGKNKV